MMNDFTALAENFDIQTAEDGSTTITFDGPAIVNTVKAVENVVDNAMPGYYYHRFREQMHHSL